MEDFEKIFFGRTGLLGVVVLIIVISTLSICIKEFIEAIRCNDLKNYKQNLSVEMKRIYGNLDTKAWVIVAVIVSVFLTGNFFIDKYKTSYGLKYEKAIRYETVKFDAILKLKGEHYSPEIDLPCVIELAGSDAQVYRIEDGELVADEGKAYYTIKANKLYLPHDKIIDGKDFYIDYNDCGEEDYKSVDGYKIFADMPVNFNDNYCEGRIIIIRERKGEVKNLNPNTLSSPAFLVGFKDSDVYHYANCRDAKEGIIPLFFTDHEMAKLFGYSLCEKCEEKVGLLHMEDYFDFYGNKDILQWITIEMY